MREEAQLGSGVKSELNVYERFGIAQNDFMRANERVLEAQIAREKTGFELARLANEVGIATQQALKEVAKTCGEDVANPPNREGKY